MMIIVADAFADAVEPFAEWKRRTGFRVELVRLSDIGGSPSDNDIKARIQDAYDTWSDPHLGYVLMVGDTDFTPIHNGDGGSGTQVTDNWYVCLDGSDYLPDAAIARISTRSVTASTSFCSMNRPPSLSRTGPSGPASSARATAATST